MSKHQTNTDPLSALAEDSTPQLGGTLSGDIVDIKTGLPVQLACYPESSKYLSFWLCIPVTVPFVTNDGVEFKELKHARRLITLPSMPSRNDTIWLGRTLDFVVASFEFLLDVDDSVEVELHTDEKSVQWMSDNREFLLEFNFDLSEVV